MTSRLFTLFYVLIAILLDINCGSGNNDKRQILSLVVEPAIANPAPGATVKFTATGRFNIPPSSDKVTPLSWLETAQDSWHGGTGIAAVDQSGLAHCTGTGTTWITAEALSGVLNKYGDPVLVRGTAQLNCP